MGEWITGSLANRKKLRKIWEIVAKNATFAFVE